jgi:hypothetical protein
MTTYPPHRTTPTGPFTALLIALAMAFAILSLSSIHGTARHADPMPAATPAPGFS